MKQVKKPQKMDKKVAEGLSMNVLVRRSTLFLAALAFILFANTISNDYNLDDELVTRNHPLTSRGMEAISDIFTSPYYSDAMGYAYGYRPIVHVSFALEHQLFGEDPHVSHFFNVLLFVFAVVGFFKLLVRWTGEKQLLVAFLATLFFVVHPIHTEVVASIKNRDEILAFLFVIYSALSMEKYLSKGKITSLIWIFVLFTLAMLSKKSAFPMAIFLPVAAVFLHAISWKKLSFVSLAFLIPAIPIAAEFGLERIGLISVVSIGAIVLAYYINQLNFKELNWKYLLMDYRLWGSVSVLFLFYGVWEDQLIFCFIALFVLVFGLRKKEKLLVYLFVLEGVVVYSIFPEKEIVQFLFLISLFYLFKCKLQNIGIWALLLIITLIPYVSIMIDLQDFNELQFLFTCVFFVFLLYWKWFISILFSLFSFFFILYNSDFDFFPVYFLLVGLFVVINKNKPNLLFLPILLILVTSSFIGVFVTEKNNVETVETTTQKVSLQEQTIVPTMNFKDKDELFLKEGRVLEVVENELVLPHSPSENIATGFSTLGEYLRLHVFPYELSFYYGFAKVKTMQLSNPWVWVSILAHFILLFLGLFNLKKRPLISLGIVWYFASILLFSNWVELVAGMVGERLGFLASAGFCLFIAATLFWIKPTFSIRKPKALELSVLLIFVLFSLKTGIRNGQWKTQLDLMASDMPHLQNSAQANNLYATNLVASTFNPDLQLSETEKRQRQKLALSHYSQALSIYPQFYNAAFDKGRLAELVQDTSLAILSYQQAIAMHKSNLPDPFYNLCNLYLAKNDTKNFLKMARPLIVFDSLNVQAYNNLARGYFLNNKKDSAVVVLQKAIQKFPEDLDLKYNLEIVLKKE